MSNNQQSTIDVFLTWYIGSTDWDRDVTDGMMVNDEHAHDYGEDRGEAVTSILKRKKHEVVTITRDEINYSPAEDATYSFTLDGKVYSLSAIEADGPFDPAEAKKTYFEDDLNYKMIEQQIQYTKALVKMINYDMQARNIEVRIDNSFSGGGICFVPYFKLEDNDFVKQEALNNSYLTDKFYELVKNHASMLNVEVNWNNNGSSCTISTLSVYRLIK